MRVRTDDRRRARPLGGPVVQHSAIAVGDRQAAVAAFEEADGVVRTVGESRLRVRVEDRFGNPVAAAPAPIVIARRLTFQTAAWRL